MAKTKKTKAPRTRVGGKTIETIQHTGNKRKNIPSAEHQSVIEKAETAPRPVKYLRNTDLDPQLVWRGKDEQDWTDLVVQAPPLYIQERVHPKVLVDDLLRQSKQTQGQAPGAQFDLFGDFNGIPEGVDRTEFYRHDQNWSNRMILGDSLQVMASLAEREGLRGKVQCIYIDPPYGIKFNSNFQWSTTSSKVADGNIRQITREPEQVKAFRDTWQDGIHSYLTYLRDRVTVARDLLAESGSMFVQIGDENVHRVRCVMDEVLGENNFITIVTVKKTAGLGKGQMAEVADFVLWYGKNRETTKRRLLFSEKEPESDAAYSLVKETVGSFRRVRPGESVATWDYLRFQILLAAGRTPSCVYPATVFGSIYQPTAGRSWSTNREGMQRLVSSDRVAQAGRTISYVRFVADNPVNPISNVWSDTASGSGMDKIYVVQTSSKVIERCMLMATDPGDLVVDPTCGSGTTAAVAEEWGRRWITIDTSRVALALARARVMGARHPFYVLADTDDGMRKQAEATGQPYIQKPTHGNVRQGFVYERVPHITLKSIANNSEIDVISEDHQPKVEAALAALNKALRGHKTPFEVTTGGRAGEAVNFSAPENDTFAMPSGEVVPAFELVEWEVPCEAPDNWPKAAAKPFAEFWEVRIARQQAIDASIAAKAEFEHLYDKPYEDRKKVRVAGPFTVESLSPHRMLGVDENDELIDPFKVAERGPTYGVGQQFDQMVLENLRVAGVQQKDRDDRIAFTSLQPWPGQRICAEGRYREGDAERRAGILIGQSSAPSVGRIWWRLPGRRATPASTR